MFGFSIDVCAPVMLKATVAFRSRARSLQRVVYCLFGNEAYDNFRKVLDEVDK